MNETEQAASDIEAQLRAGLGSLVPDAAEKQWIADLAADLAAQKIKFASATTDEQRAEVADNLDILNATWKLRLAEKELLSQHLAENIIKTAFTMAVTCFFPQAGAFVGLAKYVVGQVVNRVNTPNPST